MNKFHKLLILNVLAIFIFGNSNINCGKRTQFYNINHKHETKKREHFLNLGNQKRKSKKEKAQQTHILQKQQTLHSQYPEINTQEEFLNFNCAKSLFLNKKSNLSNDTFTKKNHKKHSKGKEKFSLESQELTYNQALKSLFMLCLNATKNPMVTIIVSLALIKIVASKSPHDSCSCVGITKCSNHTMTKEFKNGELCEMLPGDEDILCCRPTTSCCCYFTPSIKKANLCFQIGKNDSHDGKKVNTITSIDNSVNLFPFVPINIGPVTPDGIYLKLYNWLNDIVYTISGGAKDPHKNGNE